MGDFIVLDGREERIAIVSRDVFFEILKNFEKSFVLLSEIIDCAEDANEISWKQGEDVLVFKYCWGISRINVNPQIVKILAAFLLSNIIFHKESLA